MSTTARSLAPLAATLLAALAGFTMALQADAEEAQAAEVLTALAGMALR